VKPRPMTRARGRRGVSHLRLVALLTMLLAPVLLLLAPGPAAASVTQLCMPDAETSCLTGTIRTEEGVVEGVDLTITPPQGEPTTVTTDAGGKWSLPVKEAGTYTVTLVEDSLPDGVGAVGRTEEQVDVKIGEKQTTYVALFEVRTGDYSATKSESAYYIQSFVNGLRLGLLLALASVGLSLIYGTTGLSNFAHAEQVTLGGILAYWLCNVLGLPLVLGCIISVLLCAGTGWAQDRGIWQPLRRRGLGLTQMMIVTIGLALTLQYTYQYFVGASTVKITTATSTTVDIGPITLTTQSFWAMGISIVMIALVGWVLLRTRIGRATRAVSDNPALAAASGIDVDRIIRLVWIAATGLAGLSGVLYALVVSNGIRWDTGMQILLLLFASVTLGGLGTAFGALVGSLIIGMVVEMAGPLGAPGDLKYAVALAILILLLLVRPQGLLGRPERVG
jgi:branched-chain amino acid transport system permease protein